MGGESPASSVAVEVMPCACEGLGAIVVGNVSGLQQQPVHVASVQPDVVPLKELKGQLALQ